MKEENQVVICAIAKQEYDFIYDWVAWHLRLGFDKIYIYDNNDSEGERYDELLSEFINDKRCELIDCRDEHGVQIEKYNEFYKAGRFKWCAFIDIDEFFYFKPTGRYNNIKDFLKMKKDADAYMLLWECYGSSGLKKEGHIWDNCQKLPYNVRKSTDSYLNFWHKSIVRSGLDITVNEHTICEGFYKYNIYNERGEKLTGQLSLFDYSYNHINKELCINHYLLRDIDTFFYKKYLRGHAGFANSGGTDGWIPDSWTQNINYFTDTQRFISKEEQEYLYSKGMRQDWKFYPTIIIFIHLCRGNASYFREVLDIVHYIRNSADTIVRVITDEAFIIDNNGNLPDYNLKDYNINNLFNYDRIDVREMWDSPGQDDMSMYDNYFIQKPLVLHIGAPIDDEPLPHDFFNNIIDISRDLCFHKLSGSMIFTPKELVENDPTDNLYLEANREFNMRLYHKRLKNNIFLTTLNNYNKIAEFYHSFQSKVSNDFIVENTKNRYSTPYQQFNFLWPGLINKIIEV